MADKFSKWDRFARNLEFTNNPRQALRWTAHETMVHEKHLNRLRFLADMLVLESLSRAQDSASKNTI